MKLSRNSKADEATSIDLTPMIDVIFQLLIFFVFSLKFVAFEGQLQAYLPKDRGLDSSPATIDLVNVTFFLQWDQPTQSVSCTTINYDAPDGSGRRPRYDFPPDPGVVEGADPQGGKRIETHTQMARGTKKGKVMYDYVAPNFQEIENYLRYRKETYEATAPGKDLPVTVNFTDTVPWQMVVNILDICKALGITDFSINAQEVEY